MASEKSLHNSEKDFEPNTIMEKEDSSGATSEEEKSMPIELDPNIIEDSIELPEELRDIMPAESMLVTSFSKPNQLHFRIF